MTGVLDKFPAILMQAVLLGTFVTLRHRVKSTRLQLWTFGWVLVFLHFFVQIVPAPDSWRNIIFTIRDGALQVAAISFIASLARFHQRRNKTWAVLIAAGSSFFLYTAAFHFSWDVRSLYIVFLAVVFYATPAYILHYRHKLDAESASWMPVAMAVGAWSMYHAWHHRYEPGFLASLTFFFGLTGFLFWRRYRRWSPGVLLGVTGFLLWGASIAPAFLTDRLFPGLRVNPELWNLPKYFVAFGMVLTLLEEKSDVLEAAHLRERNLNEQLQKFASITSRLLTGVEVNSLCNEIAQAITETSNFQRAIILLCTDERTLYIAGQSGFREEESAGLKAQAASWKIEHISEGCRMAAKLGQNSYLLSAVQAEKCFMAYQGAESSPHLFGACAMVIVPLQSTRGHYVGSIFLDRPREFAKVAAEEMSRIEILGGDLAVTIGNIALQRQLVRSEKLAAIGQLVAGVAHELNNPLASIVGYSELLTDEISDPPARQKLDKLLREATRMKRIIENLLRFARQNNLAKKSASLQNLLQDVISLREYHIRSQNVEVQVEIEPNLPYVAVDEDQFKQILLNLLNNSMDALEQASCKRIRVEAARRGERVIVRFEDSGPGFNNLNRVFDPFYTTKPVGKGTGLGLSICYGIVKEHGGDIYAVNMEPTGARVVLELLIYTSMNVAATVG